MQIDEGTGISVLPAVRLRLGNYQTTGTRCRQFPVGKVVPIKNDRGKIPIPMYPVRLK